MKKITFLSLALALSAGTMFAGTVQVTTTDMNPETVGSLPNVIATAPDGTETTIEFNFEGEQLDYLAATGMAIKAKTLIFDGINKTNGKPVTLKGATRLFDISSTSANVTMKNLKITGCNGIAMTITGGVSVFENCVFEKNIDPKNESGNNGGVMRISGGNVTINKSLFYKNKGVGGYGGGAICVYDDVTLRVDGCSFIENEGYSGGAIGVNVRSAKGFIPKVYIANSTFANNITSDRGGAIYMQTAEVAGVFSPVIVNCTFVGNLNGKDGGAILFWSRATTTMKPVLINNLFAENYVDPWDKSPLNDCHAFYLAGEKDINGKDLPQTVFPVTKNNMYCAAQTGFFATANGDKTMTPTTDKIFKATEQNIWDEGDPTYSHMTSTLTESLMVAMIDQASVAIGAGVASFESYEIPSTDQLGNPRGAKPAVGAVEYAQSGVENIIGNGADVKIWNIGGELFVSGAEGVATIFDLTGKIVLKGTIADGVSLSVGGVAKGVYIVKIANATAKVVF